MGVFGRSDCGGILAPPSGCKNVCGCGSRGVACAPPLATFCEPFRVRAGRVLTSQVPCWEGSAKNSETGLSIGKGQAHALAPRANHGILGRHGTRKAF